LARWFLAAIGVGAILALVVPGYLLEGQVEPLVRSDAIVVISGDEAQSRYRDGVRLYRAGWAPALIFSGATYDGSFSNAEAMRAMAVEEGIPPAAILVEPDGEDTYGNAVGTRNLMVKRGMHSAILVTSPYHLQRAVLTFRGVFAGTDIRIVGRSAPDGEWRKMYWWVRPETRTLTFRELEKLGYVTLTGRYN